MNGPILGFRYSALLAKDEREFHGGRGNALGEVCILSGKLCVV